VLVDLRRTLLEIQQGSIGIPGLINFFFSFLSSYYFLNSLQLSNKKTLTLESLGSTKKLNAAPFQKGGTTVSNDTLMACNP
jgi:hypothetical protein